MANWLSSNPFGANPRKKGQQVVIAWTRQEAEVTKPGRPDLGVLPEFKMVPVPAAVMWLRKGSAEDVEKAKRHLAKEILTEEDVDFGRVYTFPSSERDPLGKAKKMLMKELSL